MLTQNLHYNYYYPKPKYLIIGYLDPFKGPNDWVLGPSGLILVGGPQNNHLEGHGDLVSRLTRGKKMETTM